VANTVLGSGEVVCKILKAMDKTTSADLGPFADPAANVAAILAWQKAAGFDWFEAAMFESARSSSSVDVQASQLLSA
jgi:hypothetical protein